ncbi:hypothetical protein [Frankia sp. CiP3]|uniref:hypothetical protein n=1 Tax=Frankia sp. CiP3 TaxID=2880971 RepID=UPI001EF568AA|nr:hypothetical protein [Frankia sp. CiP3]
MLPGRPDLFVINIPRPVLVGLGSAVLLLVVLALVGSLDPLALAAVLSYLILYGFSLVLLRSPNGTGAGRNQPIAPDGPATDPARGSR